MKTNNMNEIRQEWKYYYREAKNFIFAKYSKHLLKNDEDFISDVAHKFMVADATFNGNGTKEGYRAYLAHNLIVSYNRLLNKPRPQSLNKRIHLEHSSKEIGDLIESEPTDNYGFYELIELCPKKYQNILEKYFLEKESIKEIAESYEVTYQCIHWHIMQALKLLKTRLENV